MERNGISHSKQRAILRERKLGFGVEFIAMDRGLSVEEVRRIVNGTCPIIPPESVWGLPATAIREMKRAEQGDFGRIAAAIRCVKHNWCDVVTAWREDI